MTARRKILLAAALLLLAAQSHGASRACDRLPPGPRRRPRLGDNGYEIRVTELGRPSTQVQRFAPGRTYEVTLRNRLPFVSFLNFYLTAALDMAMRKGEKMGKKKMMMMKDKDAAAGNFVHVANPPVTANLERCPGVVTAAGYRGGMDSVRLRWTAPTFTRDCVVFKATVVKYPGVFFKDEGKLMHRICPKFVYANDEGVLEQRPNDQPPTIKNCCACGTATYKMTFQGKWIRQLHPRDWPKNERFVHWSNIIGATHNREYFIYYLGAMASQGVQSVCQFGDASVLEKEFKSTAGNILNIIKTRGIWESKNMGESRTAIFSVNRTHHLMSMLTMLGPSPDWCAGISSQDLCRSDCTWTKKLVLDLYPWDAGIKKGNTYMPAKPEGEPSQKRIMNINKDWPRGNPFTVVNGKMRPVATVTLQRLSPKKDYQCDRKAMAGVRTVKITQNDGEEIGRPSKSGQQRDQVKDLPPNLQSMVPTMCFMTPWTSWSKCSVTCGSGTMYRKRTIRRNLKPPLCKYVSLREKKECMGQQRTCNYDKPCSVTAWSKWSPCNSTCNMEGSSMRTRTFVRLAEREICSKRVKTKETMKCILKCDDSITCSAPMVEGFRCIQPVTRYYYNMEKKTCLPFTFLGCKGSKNRFKSIKDCKRVCDVAFDDMADWQVKRLAGLQMENTRKTMLKRKGKSMRHCKLPMDVGHRCRRIKKKRRSKGSAPGKRWYFDMKTKMCKVMQFKGCSGNENNFESRENCRTTCTKLMMKKGRVVIGPPQDCRLGGWGPWAPCSQNCGGVRFRRRHIMRSAVNGGRPCRNIHQTEKCTPRRCRPCSYTAWSTWSSCTTTCGEGLMERTRQMQPDSPKQCSPMTPHVTERKYCKEKPCPLTFLTYRKH